MELSIIVSNNKSLKSDIIYSVNDYHLSPTPFIVRAIDELFEIVLQRIQDETEHLYPLVCSLGA